MQRLEGVLDPDPLNPWPHHGSIGGASMAMTCATYAAVGGLPRLACSEDRGLLALYQRHDKRVLFSDRAIVRTSGRFDGRARGGMADTLVLREWDTDAPLDARAEPAVDWHARLLTRATVRRLHRDTRALGAFCATLGIAPEIIRRIADEGSFGAAWAETEHAGALSQRQRLHPSDLPEQSTRLKALLTVMLGSMPDHAPGELQRAPMADRDPKGQEPRTERVLDVPLEPFPQHARL